jgi:hypothetical protein
MAVAAGLSASGPALAVDSTDTVDVNVVVGSGITLTVAETSFALTGLPGATAETTSAVSLTVTTNNPTGYTVSVQPAAATLTTTEPGVTDTISTADIQVKDSAGAYANLTPGSPLTVNTKGTASAVGGDAYTHDYQIVVPFVAPATYTGTLNYVASTT